MQNIKLGYYDNYDNIYSLYFLNTVWYKILIQSAYKVQRVET